MSRASEEALDGLHAMVAQVLTGGLKTTTEDVFNDKGEKTGTRKVTPSPQMVAQAIKFLKDNGIDAPAKLGRMTGLAQALADLDLDDVASSTDARH